MGPTLSQRQKIGKHDQLQLTQGPIEEKKEKMANSGGDIDH